MMDAFGRTFLIFITLVVGGVLAVSLPEVLDAVAPADAPAMWWASRVLGIVAYVALWAAMLFGVFMSSRGAGGLLHPATVLEMHNRWAVAALLLTVLHVLVTVADPEHGITPLALVYPFASPTQTGEVALGTLALWGMGAIAGTTAAFRKVPKWVWRAVHAAAFGAYVLALMHGFTAGMDVGNPIVTGIYVATTTVLLAAIVQRLLLAWERGRGASGS